MNVVFPVGFEVHIKVCTASKNILKHSCMNFLFKNNSLESRKSQIMFGLMVWLHIKDWGAFSIHKIMKFVQRRGE